MEDEAFMGDAASEVVLEAFAKFMEDVDVKNSKKKAHR
jgi:hypothetical protein